MSVLDTDLECYECGETLTRPAQTDKYRAVSTGVMSVESGDAAGWTHHAGDPVACIPAHWLCEDCS